jgi:hypothetical protein
LPISEGGHEAFGGHAPSCQKTQENIGNDGFGEAGGAASLAKSGPRGQTGVVTTTIRDQARAFLRQALPASFWEGLLFVAESYYFSAGHAFQSSGQNYHDAALISGDLATAARLLTWIATDA